MDNCNKLWIVEFTVNKKNGCAVVKAPNPKVVETILRTNGKWFFIRILFLYFLALKKYLGH